MTASIRRQHAEHLGAATLGPHPTQQDRPLNPPTQLVAPPHHPSHPHRGHVTPPVTSGIRDARDLDVYERHAPSMTLGTFIDNQQ